MIKFNIDKRITLEFTADSDEEFASLVSMSKLLRLRFLAKEKLWLVPAGSFENALESFRDIGIVEVEPESYEHRVLELIAPKKELEYKQQRIIPDYSLMNFKPIPGKTENFQHIDIKSALLRNRYGIFLDMGLGKATSLDTQIQSPAGPILMRNIKVGSKIFNTYGSTSTVQGVFPQGEIETVEFIMSDGSPTCTSLDHIWTVEDKRNNYEKRDLTSKEIVSIIKEHRINSGYSIFKLPEVLPVNYPQNDDIEISPYMIGALIGNGCLTSSVSITCAKEDKWIVDRCSRELKIPHRIVEDKNISFYFRKSLAKKSYKNPVKSKLEELDLMYKKSYCKLIPEKYLRSSVKDRIDLLQGLMDTDGYINKDGSTIQLGVRNEKLVLQVKELIESLGGRITNNKKFLPKNTTAGLYGKYHFNLTFKLPETIVPFSLPRKVKRISNKTKGSFRYIKDFKNYGAIKECQCITVDSKDSLFLIDSYIPTHNSYIFSTIAAHYLFKWKTVSKILVLSSNTGTRNLPEEFKKFIKGFDEISYTIAGKNNRKPFIPETDIVFSSYNSFRLVCKAYQKTKTAKPRKPFIPFEEWFGDKDGLLLMDESHQAANPSSQQGNFVAIHSPAFKNRYLATGTPADKPEKLYNQLKILDASLTHGFGYSEWKEYYANLGNRFSLTAITGWKKDKIALLNKSMQEYSIFRKTEDTIALPDNIEKRIYCDLSAKHRKIYTAFVNTTMEANKYETGGYDVKKISNLFPYLALALHNPKLLTKHFDKFPGDLVSNIEKFNYANESDAFTALKEVIEDHSDEKGVVWVIHPSTARELEVKLAHLNPIVITGDVDESLRKGLVDSFRLDKKHKILIANVMVLNTSYTIVEAKWQFYLERNYDYTSFSQSKKRIHRIGQDKTVRTYYAIYKNTLDIMLDANLRNKGTLVSGLVGKKFLTKAEWANIFNPQGVEF